MASRVFGPVAAELTTTCYCTGVAESEDQRKQLGKTEGRTMPFPGRFRPYKIRRGERDPASEHYALGAMTSSLVQRASQLSTQAVPIVLSSILSHIYRAQSWRAPCSGYKAKQLYRFLRKRDLQQ